MPQKAPSANARPTIRNPLFPATLLRRERRAPPREARLPRSAAFMPQKHPFAQHASNNQTPSLLPNPPRHECRAPLAA